MTLASTSSAELEPIGASLGGLVVFEGETECAKCGATTRRVLLGGHEVPMLCDACQAVADQVLEAEEREDRVRQLMTRSGQTPKLLQYSLDSYPTDGRGKAAKAAAMQWLDAWSTAKKHEPVPNLMLVGGVGTGKTGLAWSLVREVIEKHATSARLVNWRVLLSDMQAAMHDRSLSVQDALGLDKVPVLCIDDLGSERPTDWRREELANLVERRDQNLLPTIITSNYMRAELEARLGHDDPTIGARILSRLTENAIVVRFEGPDRRSNTRRVAA